MTQSIFYSHKPAKRQDKAVQVVCIDCGTRAKTYIFFIDKGCKMCGGELIQDNGNG